MYRNIAVVGMVALLLAAADLSSAALAEPPVAVGSGQNTAHVLINFGSGANYQFDVSFDGDVKGIALLDMIDAETALEAHILEFDFGRMVDGFSYDGHSDIGYGGGEDWWHYWTRESAEDDWVSADVGAGGRTVDDGTWDGWVYGRGTEPVVPEPGTFALLAVAACAALPGSRRRIHRGNVRN